MPHLIKHIHYAIIQLTRKKMLNNQLSYQEKILQKTVKRAAWIANYIFILSIVFFLSISCFLHLTPAYAQPLQIAVLPFEINAEQNLDFLKKGIQDMLASRLSFKDQVNVIDKESVQKTASGIKGFTGESFALLVGGQLKADFVIYGSVTIIGNSTSIDSKLVDISGKNPPISFYRQTTDPGGVIPAVNQFATTINETLFNRGDNTASTTIVSQQPAQTSGVNTAAAQSSLPPVPQTAQPVSGQLNSNFTIKNQAQSSDGQLSSPNPQFSVTTSVRGKSGVWQSPSFKHLINGIAIADTDKDNIMETVFISDKVVYIQRFSGNRLIKVAETPKNRLLTYIAVGVGDINNNGKEEIFVTALNVDKNMPSSFVLEHDGSQYVEIAKDIPWYFRVVETKNEGKILLGQKQRTGKYNIYDSPIYIMKWDGEKYLPSDTVLESGRANVLGALFDDVTGEKNPMIVAYDHADHIALFSQNGNVLWRDLNRSGGNMNYFNLPKEDPKADESFKYFPISLRSADINGDGLIEVLYASNSDITGGYLSKFKRYSKGVVNCIFWNETGFSLHWSTPEQQGRISDFVIGDFDNDGVKELVISNVIKDSLTTFTDSESLITVYELMQ